MFAQFFASNESWSNDSWPFYHFIFLFNILFSTITLPNILLYLCAFHAFIFVDSFVITQLLHLLIFLKQQNPWVILEQNIFCTLFTGILASYFKVYIDYVNKWKSVSLIKIHKKIGFSICLNHYDIGKANYYWINSCNLKKEIYC